MPVEVNKFLRTADTVGYRFKDTAGPAINPFIKVMNLVAFIAAPLIIKFRDTL